MAAIANERMAVMIVNAKRRRSADTVSAWWIFSRSSISGSVGIAGLRYSGLRIRDAFELVFRVPWLGELLPQDLVDRISFVASGRQSDIKFAGRKQQKIQQHTNTPLPHAISS